MRKFPKYIKNIFYLIFISLILYILIMIIAPEKIDNILDYKFYSVLTNSMEPKIPTYSLVCIKKFKKDEIINLKPQQIITFHAERFGENIILTHYFNKTEINEDGTIVYRTNSEGKANLDSYKTTRDDLIGTYVFHIPYIGKFIIFLKSKFGFILYGELIIIFLIDSLIRNIWNEKEKTKISKHSKVISINKPS